jgi:hypothetical protein
MTRGKQISPDLRQVIYHMSLTIPAAKIVAATKVPLRTVRRIIKEGKAGLDFQPNPRSKRFSYVFSEQDIQVSTNAASPDTTDRTYY